MRSDRTPLPHLSKLLLLRAEHGHGMWRHVTWQWCVMTWQWCLPRILRILLRFPPLPTKCRKRNCNESLCPKRNTTPLHASASPRPSSMAPSQVSATHSIALRHTRPCPSLHASPVTPFFPLSVPARPRPSPLSCLPPDHSRSARPVWGQAEPSCSGFVASQPCVPTARHYRSCPYSSSSVPNAETE